MSFPSFEETNHPGYDEVFNKDSKDKFDFFKALGNFFNNPTAKLVNEKIQEEDILGIFKIMNSGYKLNNKQEHEFLKKFTKGFVFDDNILEDALNKGITVPGKCLIDYILHKNGTFRSDIHRYMYKNEVDEKYPCKHLKLKELCEEKFKDENFKRNLFLSWYKLAEDAVYSKAEYITQKNTDDFYKWPHDYFEYKIWNPLATLKEYMFSNVTEEEYLNCLTLFKKYPKIPGNIDKQDILYCKQNSAYWNAQSVGYNIEKWGCYVKNKKNTATTPMFSEVELPTISEGVLKEIKLVYQELQKDLKLLNLEEQFEIQNIYKKRLPQLLSKYQDVHHRYRNGLKDSDKNPNDMLYASLVDIQEIFNKKNEAINKQKLEQLDINSRYIKEIKNKMAR